MNTAAERTRPRSTSRVGRNATIHIRAPQETKDLIESAASVVGKSLSEFTLESARKHATDVLLDQRLFVLDSDQYVAFMKALDNPPTAGSKLRALLKRRPLWQK
jgi:uncharacterized protein (DUF1778 family)